MSPGARDARVEDHFTGRILIGAAYDTLAAEAET